MKYTLFLVRVSLFFGLSLLSQAGISAIVPAGPQVSIYGGVSHTNGYTRPSRVIPNGYLDNELDTRSAHNNGPNFMPGIGVAYDFLTSAGQNCNLIHDFSLGLDLYYLNTGLKGQVYLYGNQALNYYNYKLNFNSTQLMIDALVNFRRIGKVTPFIQLGYGAAIIQDSYNSSLSSSAPPLTPAPGYSFSGKTNYNPAYTLGAGLKFPVSKHVSVSIRYLFTDLGSVETGGGIISNGSIVTPVKARLRPQAILAGLTYSFA